MVLWCVAFFYFKKIWMKLKKKKNIVPCIVAMEQMYASNDSVLMLLHELAIIRWCVPKLFTLIWGGQTLGIKPGDIIHQLFCAYSFLIEHFMKHVALCLHWLMVMKLLHLFIIGEIVLYYAGTKDEFDSCPVLWKTFYIFLWYVK